jgi:hypothetical protein
MQLVHASTKEHANAVVRIGVLVRLQKSSCQNGYVNIGSCLFVVLIESFLVHARNMMIRPPPHTTTPCHSRNENLTLPSDFIYFFKKNIFCFNNFISFSSSRNASSVGFLCSVINFGSVELVWNLEYFINAGELSSSPVWCGFAVNPRSIFNAFSHLKTYIVPFAIRTSSYGIIASKKLL